MDRVAEEGRLSGRVDPTIHVVKIEQLPLQYFLAAPASAGWTTFSLLEQGMGLSTRLLTCPARSIIFRTLGSQPAKRLTSSEFCVTAVLSPLMSKRPSPIDFCAQQNTTLYNSPPRMGYPITWAPGPHQHVTHGCEIKSLISISARRSCPGRSNLYTTSPVSVGGSS